MKLKQEMIYNSEIVRESPFRPKQLTHHISPSRDAGCVMTQQSCTACNKGHSLSLLFSFSLVELKELH